MNADLFPKPPRRMKQPTKNCLRETIAQQTDALMRMKIEQERLVAENAELRRPFWRRFFSESTKSKGPS